MKTQKKLQKSTAISLEAFDLKSIKADMGEPNNENVTKEELYQVCGQLVDMMRSVMDRCMQRDNGIVDAVNSWTEEHTAGHMPALDNSQKMKIFAAAGMEDEVEMEKTDIECENCGIWASKLPTEQVEKLNAIKIQVK